MPLDTQTSSRVAWIAARGLQDLTTVTPDEIRTVFASVVTQTPQHGANAVLRYGRTNKPHLRPTLAELADFYLKSEV
jgi:hypothetical protein